MPSRFRGPRFQHLGQHLPRSAPGRDATIPSSSVNQGLGIVSNAKELTWTVTYCADRERKKKKKVKRYSGLWKFSREFWWLRDPKTHRHSGSTSNSPKGAGARLGKVRGFGWGEGRRRGSLLTCLPAAAARDFCRNWRSRGSEGAPVTPPRARTMESAASAHWRRQDSISAAAAKPS